MLARLAREVSRARGARGVPSLIAPQIIAGSLPPAPSTSQPLPPGPSIPGAFFTTAAPPPSPTTPPPHGGTAPPAAAPPTGAHVFDEHDTIVGQYTPVTKQLWQQRYRWDREALAAAHPQTAFPPKPPSSVAITYPFSTDPALREHFRNPWNGVRVALLLEDMDSMAGFTAYAHVDDGDAGSRPPVLVTATVESILVNPPALTIDEDLVLTGRVIWTGTSSLDILVEARQGAHDGGAAAPPPNMSALFTFVARDPVTGKPQRVNPLAPDDADTAAAFAARQRVADGRKAARKAAAGQRWTAEQVAWAQALLARSHLKRDLPALVGASAVFMPETALENTFTTQPQQRNIHGSVFGGTLMHSAFSLAHSTAYVLAASRPRTLLVDEIQFKRAVLVGDLVRFRSRVLRAWDAPEEGDPGRGVVHVQVAASVVRPEAAATYETNTFNFLFAVERRRLGDGTLAPMPEALPTTEEAALEVCAFYGPGGEARRARWGTAVPAPPSSDAS